MTDKARLCSERIWDHGRWPSQSGCQNRGSVTEDGKSWCKTHAPSRVKARRDALHARWRAASEAREATWQRGEALTAATAECIEALRQIARGQGEPGEVARAALARLDASERKEGTP